MRLPQISFITALLCAGTAAPVAFAATAPQFSLGLGVDYASGDFGTNSTSTYTTLPLTIDWFPNERLSLELTVPFLSQSTGNTGNAATGGGVISAMSYSGGTGMNGSGMHGAATNSGNQSGLGDITLVPVYNVWLDSEKSPKLGLTGYLKFPTADADKGLGTGAFDWGPGLQLSKWLGDWQPFAEGRYVFQGSSRPEIGARNYFLVDAGLGYGWSENLYTAMFSRFGSAAFAGMASPLEMRLKTVWALGEKSSTEFYLLKGISDGSPNYGGGISFFVNF